MNKFYFSLVLFLSISFVKANEAEFVVKVASSVCGFTNSKMLGSGVLFNYNESVYVLTSEHVVYHSHSNKYCHQISNEGISQKAELLFADWGRGIALLKVNMSPSNTYLNYPEDFSNLQSKKVIVAGVPYGESQVFSSDSGKVATAKSKRLLSAMINETLEIEGAHGEFGMSGGAILGEKGNKLAYLGLLSHQVLVIKPGMPTQTAEWDINQKYQNQLLAIKSSDIKLVLDNYFQSPEKFKVSFYRDPMGQLNRTNALVGHGLIYTPQLKSIAGHTSDNESTTPIGGVDPIGIGGEEENVLNYTSLLVDLFSSTEEFSTLNASVIFPGYQSSVDKIKNVILLHQKVEVPYLLFQNDEMNLIAKRARSLAHFFNLLKDTRYSVVIRNLSQDQSTKIVTLGIQNLELLEKFPIENLMLQNHQYFIALMTLANLAKENNLEIANCQLINHLIERSSDTDQFWQELLGVDFNSATKLLQNTKYFAKICQ